MTEHECRTRTGERYWRFVDIDGTVIDTDAEMLRRISSGSAPAVDPSNTAIDLESAWRAALESILDEHNRRADPREAEDRLGPVQRFAIEVLRDPAIALPPGAEDVEEALSVERSSAVRQALAEVRKATADSTISRDQAAEHIVAIVRSFGLQAVEPAPALPVIEESDVGVVCWMGVLPPM